MQHHKMFLSWTMLSFRRKNQIQEETTYSLTQQKIGQNGVDTKGTGKKIKLSPKKSHPERIFVNGYPSTQHIS